MPMHADSVLDHGPHPFEAVVASRIVEIFGTFQKTTIQIMDYVLSIGMPAKSSMYTGMQRKVNEHIYTTPTQLPVEHLASGAIECWKPASDPRPSEVHEISNSR